MPGAQLVLGQRYFGEQNDHIIAQFAQFAVWSSIRRAAEIESNMTNGVPTGSAAPGIDGKLDQPPAGPQNGNLVFANSGSDDCGFNF